MALGQSIEVENLGKAYKGGIQAFNGLSFEVGEGSIFDL